MVGASMKRQFAAIFALAAQLVAVTARDVNCGCGYLDPVTGDLWTDTTILYFNETTEDALAKNPDFVDLNFTNLYEEGFDTIYRQGASTKNVGFGTRLRLKVDPSTKDHLVVGGGIRTSRQDIQYGSFRAGLQPSSGENFTSGTALSMYYKFNGSQSINVHLANGPMGNNAFYKADLPGATLDPKNYTFYNVSQENRVFEMNEWRFDWTKKLISFSNSLNASNDYNISKSKYPIPSVPGPVYFKHWSTGAASLSQGPPKNPSTAYVGYIRIFFNSTITSTEQAFGQQCSILQMPVCSTEDMTLRTSSQFTEESAKRWVLVLAPYHPPDWAYYGCIVSGTLLGLLLVHAIIRRLFRHYSVPKAERPVHPDAYTYKLDRFALHGELTREMVKEKKRNEKAEKKALKRGETPIVKTREIDPDAASISSFATTVEPDQSSVRGFRSLAGNKNSKVIASALPTMYYARPGSAQGQSGQGPSGQGRAQSRLNQAYNGSDADEDEDDRRDSDMSDDEDQIDREADEEYANLPRRDSDDMDRDDTESVVAFRAAVKELPVERKKSIFPTVDMKTPTRKFWRRLFTSDSKGPVAEKPAPVINTSSRIDYLDGLRGLCCLIVSLVHYVLTFYHGMLSPDPPEDEHYVFVRYIRFTIAPFFFNANFGIGIFFILSSRLIGARYLKTGMLQDLAGATFRRIPRLAFPVLCAVTLEYFLIGVGATQWLKYLGSVSWSTWAYAVEFKNVGWFINEYLALLFVQPPELPKIIYNYCTGVLWTIPVSIMGSWLIFLGVIVVREIKTPWKRFGYYFFCMVNGWYALNWSAYFWIGLAICDLDQTYKYRTWAAKRWKSWIIVLCLWGITFAFMSTQWVQQAFPFSLQVYDYAIHPDLLTGLPIGQTPRFSYPPFQFPEIHALFASTCIILLCDFSSSMQAVLRWKFLRSLGYYSYSIYLLHGIVFWSWGSWLTVIISTKGVPYWANQLIVFTTSYLLLAIAIYVWTPFADVFSGYAGNALWRRAQGRSFFATIG